MAFILWQRFNSIFNIKGFWGFYKTLVVFSILWILIQFSSKSNQPFSPSSFLFHPTHSSMAAQPKTWDDKLFEGLSPHGKEFMLPNVFNPWLVEEFVLTPHLRLKAYPTRTCDDYFLYKTLTNPSVPLVASVEKFFLGDNDNPLSYNDGEGCGLQLDRECDIESGSFPGSGHLENVQSYVNASRADLPISSNHLEPSSVDEH